MTRNKRRVNAKSIMGVMMLAAGKGALVNLEVDGPDEQACFDAILQLIQAKFGESE
jgi:phosphocarrier protein